MDSDTDICKYHFLRFVTMTIIQAKVISGHQVKRSNEKKTDLELRYMFLGQCFTKSKKNDLKTTLFDASKSVKSQNEFLHVLCHVAKPFLKIST